MSFDCKVPLIEDLRDIASSMLKTRFVIATDSAFAHLAILLQVPLIVLWGEAPGIVPTQEYKKSCHARMEVLKKGFVYHLAGAWDDPNFAINEVLKIINK
jgi:ADP-heptose:LPS heptosyltransferase